MFFDLLSIYRKYKVLPMVLAAFLGVLVFSSVFVSAATLNVNQMGIAKDDNTNFGSSDNEAVGFDYTGQSLTLNQLFAGEGFQYTYTILNGGTYDGASPAIAVIDLADGRHIVLFPGWGSRTGTHTLQFSDTIAHDTGGNNLVDFTIYNSDFSRIWSSNSQYGNWNYLKDSGSSTGGTLPLTGNEAVTRVAIQHQAANTGEEDRIDSMLINSVTQYGTIQGAVNSASFGDTINVATGTYEESLAISKPLALVGVGSIKPVITGTSGTNYIVKIDSTNTVVIDNVEVNGQGFGTGDNGFDYGILVKDSDAVTIMNSIVKNVWKVSSNGIGIEESTNTIVHDTTISSFHKRGIRYINSDGIFYKNEVIGDNVDGTSRVQNLVNLWGGSTVEIYENVLRNALSPGETRTWDSPGIFVSSYGGSGDSYAYIHGNKIYDCDSGIIVTSVYATSDGSSADITDNNLHDLEWAINFEKPTGTATISGNTFSNNDYDLHNMANIDGSDIYYGSIQTVIGLASNGNTIKIAAGNYAEKLNLVSKSLTIEGAGIDNTIIDASSFTGYAIQEFGDSSSIKGLTLIGTGSSSSSYGFKVSHVSDITLENIKVENSYKTGIDLNTVDGATLNNIEVVDTISGFGLMILDSNDVAVTNIKTSGNAWGGVSVQTKNAISDSISFNGFFDVMEDTSLLLEKDPSIYYDIANVQIPDKFQYVVYAFREGNNYKQWFYQETLDSAKSLAQGLIYSEVFTYSNLLIYDIEEENYYVIEGMKIQDSIDDASEGDTINVATGTYAEQILISKALTLNGSDGAVLDGATLGLQKDAVRIESGDVTFNNVDVTNFSGNGIIVGYEAPIPGNLLNVHITNSKISNIQPGYSHGFGIYVGYESEAFGYTPPELTTHLDYSGLLIENNEITNTHSSALVLQSIIGITSPLQVSNNNIHHNTENSGIWIDSARNIEIKNNIVNNNKWGIEFSSYAEESNTLNGPYSPKNIVISGNEIINTVMDGIVLYEAWPGTISVHKNKIQGNVPGMKNYLAESLNATNNWWGDLSGPYHVTSNSDGQGDEVSDNVDYDPWYLGSAMTELNSAEQIILTETTEVTGATDKDVVIPPTNPSATILIPDTVIDATINLAPIVTKTDSTVKATLTGSLNITALTSVGNVNVQIPTGVTISGSTAWTGKINVPTVKLTPSASVTPSSGKVIDSVTSVIEIGFGDVELTFDKAVRLVIPDRAGELAGYSRGTTFTPITLVCPSPTSQTIIDLWFAEDSSRKDCKIDYNGDLVIWTKHFTEFITYTESDEPTTPAPAPTGGGGGGGVSSSVSVSISNYLTSIEQSAESSARYTVNVENKGTADGTFSISIAGLPETYYVLSDPITIRGTGTLAQRSGQLHYTITLPADAVDDDFTVTVKGVGPNTDQKSYAVTMKVLSSLATAGETTTTTIPAGTLLIDTAPITGAVTAAAENNVVRIALGAVALFAVAAVILRSTVRKQRNPWKTSYYTTQRKSDMVERMKGVKKRFKEEKWSNEI